MQRRLSLALALVHHPDVIVLDEPEAGLDPQSRIKVREYIRSLARQATVILTTHNMDEADRVADRIAIIDHGELLVLDAPEALKRRVGAGDVVEIDLSQATLNAEQIRLALAPFEPRAAISLVKDTLTVRTLNVLNLLPDILETLSACGVHCDEVHLRENTLEDVFIQLTGRRLRE
jgi:ABC-2 type transport system ATP-binding protein